MTTQTDALAAGLRTLTEAVRAAAVDPTDQIRLLAQMAGYAPPAAGGTPPVGPGDIGIAGFASPDNDGQWATTSRSTAATFFDADGAMNLAVSYQVRPLFSGGVLEGVLAEAASLNIIADSQGMSAFSSTGDSTIVSSGDVPELLPSNIVKKCTITAGAGSKVAGFLTSAGQTATHHYATSIFVWLPAGTPITSVLFQAESGVSSSGATLAVDLTKTGQWQRVGEIYVASAAGSNLVLRVNAPVNGAVIYATCVQDEESATNWSSYFPTSGAPATRAADVISYVPAVSVSPAPIEQAIAAARLAAAALARRAALTSLARAVAAYQPHSFDDAVAVRKIVTAVLDPEIRVAADAGDTATFLALRKLRAAVVADLSARGADLPRLTTIIRAQAMPSLALAYQLYQDASRSDDLVARADPPNPAFMPVSFRALSR